MLTVVAQADRRSSQLNVNTQFINATRTLIPPKARVLVIDDLAVAGTRELARVNGWTIRSNMNPVGNIVAFDFILCGARTSATSFDGLTHARTRILLPAWNEKKHIPSWFDIVHHPHRIAPGVLIGRITPETRFNLTVSVVIPTLNEVEIVPAILDDFPTTFDAEIIFVDGHSTDGTWQAIKELSTQNINIPITALRQVGVGKADAATTGFHHASGDILMILDADLTVAPHELNNFYDALRTGTAEFAIGDRFKYKMEPMAMPPLNRLANHFFASALSRLTNRLIPDSLCGTKAMFRDDYIHLPMNPAVTRSDPFGDFALVHWAARHHLKFLSIPIHYRARKNGASRIQRWRAGFRLLGTLRQMIMCPF